MKKRVLSLFMALALCFSMLPTAALAEEAGAAPDAANANSTYTTGEDAGLAGGKDDSVPDDTDGGDTDSSGEMQGGEADAAAEAGTHTAHCVCGKDSSTTVKGHTTHSTNTAWKAADSLPNSAGSYYLTQSVSENWTVPTDGEVNLCLNGQTINGKITVGSGATLTLTDCSDSGRVQGEVLVNGGKLELYSGTITGGVQVGKKGADYQTGSSFTMYGGAITGNEDYGGVFLVGTTNHIDPPSFTMHGGTISNNTAGASDGGGGGVYVGEKCSFTMDGGTITGNTATKGNGGGIYIHFNAGSVSISNATITGNKASATGNTSYGHGGGIYSQRGVTVKNVTITGNNSTYEGGGIYGKGAIALTDATVTGNNQYDVYYDGKEGTTPELTVSGSVKAGYYANYAWKLPIFVSGTLSADSVIRVGVYEGINPGAIAEPASGVTLSAENFKADAADSVTSLGNDGKVYLVPCTHEMDDTGYTCKKCKTQFDARVGDSAYYKTLTDAFNAARGSTVTLLRNVTLTGNCSSENYSATLDLNGKTVSTENKYIHVGGGNKSNTLTVKDSSKGGVTQALNVKFSVGSNGTLAVDDSYTGEISRVELQAGGALERFGGKIGELVLSNAAYGSTSTGYGLKLWKGNPNACTIGKITDNTKSKSLTVNDLLGTDYAKCELYGEKDSVWSIVPKTEKISELTGYTAYKVQFTECVHQCADDSNPVCSVCHKDLYTKITAKAADGTTKTAYFTEDSALENGYVEAIQTLNGWSNEGCTEPMLTLLRDMYAFGTSMPLTGTLTLKGGTHTAKNVTVAKGADVTFASGSYQGATIDGTATVEAGVTFTDAGVTVNGTLNAKGGTFTGNVKFNGSSIANISGGSFNNEKKYGGVEFDYNVTGTISGGTFVFADFYTTKVKLSGGTFTMIKTNGDRKLADLLAEGAAYYGASDNQAVTNDGVNTLENVKVVSHTHNGGKEGNGTCSICGKQMAASLTVGDKTSWYTAFASAIEAANAADGEKTITLYQDVNGYAGGQSTTYELTNGPVTLATGGKSVTRANLTAKGISLTVTGSNGGFNVSVDGKDAELTVNDKDTKLAIVTAKNGGKLSLSNGTFSRVAVKDDGSSASLSGGSYGEITSGTDYVKPYALLAKGYAYKKEDNKWVSNANIGLSKVTVEKAPFAVEKIYPNNDTNYTGSSAFATDGNITLTAVIASEPETENVTYYYWWELFNESENDWTTSFKKVNTATHTGEKSKTLTISGLPVDKSYQYHIYVQCSNGYNCYSEPFTVTRHEHSWTYTASGATITAKCSKCSASGGSVTIAAPAELTYSGEAKPATVTASSDWQGPAASGITISYIKTGKYGPEKLENDALPTKAGEYTASITLGEATASVTYTIGKATPKAEDFTFTAPTSLTYDGNVKSATVTEKIGVTGMGDVTVKYFKNGAETEPKDAGDYTVKVSVAEGANYNATTDDLTTDDWKFTIGKATQTITVPTDKTIVKGGIAEDISDWATVAGVTGGSNPGTLSYVLNSQAPEGVSLTGNQLTVQPTCTAAQFTIKVTAEETGNYNKEEQTFTVKVADKNTATVIITGLPDTVTYGQEFTLTASQTGDTTSANKKWTWDYDREYFKLVGPNANTETITLQAIKAGTPSKGITATYESGTHKGSATVNAVVEKKEVTVSGITAENKEYDGNTNATVNASGATITGKVDGDDLTVSVAAGSTFDSADAGSRTVTLGTLTLDGTSAGNYTLATSGNQATATANITVRDLTVKPNSGQRKSYGTTPDPVLAYTSTGTVTGETAAFDGALSREAGEDVGQYDITKGSLELKDSGTFKATNYNLVLDTAVVTFEITKGTYSGSTPTKTVNILKNYAGVQTGTLTAADFFTTAPAEAKITNAVPNAASSNMMSIAGADSSGNFTYDSKTNITAASDESWTVTISSKNYTDITGTLTFKLVDKTDVSAQITFPNGTLTYNGAGQKYEKATISGVSGGTWNYTYVANSGTGASLDSAGLPKTAGTYTVTAKYEDDAHIGTKNATLTVSKATPTGAPTCTKITTSGKTLADAPLAIGTIAPAGGTLAWDMAANTVVAANTAYGWTYTPADTANYKALTGSLTPYAVSSGGGGGGGSYTPSYTVSVDKTVNGTITVSPKSASKGDTVTITVKPDKGYELDTLKVLDKNGDKVKLTEKNGKYTFTMPAGKVTVKGSFVEEAPEQIFTDVPVDAYFYEAVKWAAEKGITGGVGNGLFAPNQPCTRAQIVTFLWRAAGSPGPKTMSGFSDVPADSYYAKAVAWAVENGITGGTGDGKFSPDATCTRAQAVTFLYRASGAPAVSGNAAFSDVATNAYYAAAVKWAEKNGITGGIGGGLFGSDNNCTRAQIVTFLYRNYQSK